MLLLQLSFQFWDRIYWDNIYFYVLDVVYSEAESDSNEGISIEEPPMKVYGTKYGQVLCSRHVI